jgi:uncharacterized protein
MKSLFIPEPIRYTGEELRPHWIYSNFGLLGEAVVSFVGPCDVPIDNMVDLEDVRHNDAIFSMQMLHFIIEIFNLPLREGVLVQRLFTTIMMAKLDDLLKGASSDVRLRRFGDDIFVNDTKKLSVSICTLSPTSSLIHAGLNIESDGTPVEAAGLTSELGLSDIQGFAEACMNALVDEWEDINRCCCKVKAVV